MLELALVIVIIGIVAAVAIPKFRSGSLGTDAAVSKLANDIRYAQNLSMTTRRHTWVVFDTSAETYQIYIEDPNNLGNKAARIYVKNPLDQTDFVVDFTQNPWTGIDIASASFDGTSELEFNSIGTPQNGNGVSLSAAGAIVVDGQTLTIQAETGALKTP